MTSREDSNDFDFKPGKLLTKTYRNKVFEMDQSKEYQHSLSFFRVSLKNFQLIYQCCNSENSLSQAFATIIDSNFSIKNCTVAILTEQKFSI